MLKVFTSWKKYLPRINFGPEEFLQAKNFLKRRGLYFVFLALVLAGSYYLVTNNAVFRDPDSAAYLESGSAYIPPEPRPKEPIAGSTTVPQQMEKQTEAVPAPATVPGPGREEPAEGLPSLTMPLTGEVSTGYGFAYFPAFGDYRFHPGIDIEAPAGTEVRAAGGGTVKHIEYSDAWKYRLRVDMGNGYQVVYAHLNSVKVGKGDRVQAGAVLGILDEPGTAEAGTPAHLHLELLKNGSTIDPIPTLK